MADRPPPLPVRPGRRYQGDLLASVVVFLVALPLCIGIAKASGLPPEAGLVSGIVGGLVVGLLAGSPLQVSGPAAGLIVLVVQQFDELDASGYGGPAAFHLFGVIVALSGLLQILAGVLRLGQWFRAVSPAVVGGMLAGIGITIVAKQFHEMFDDEAPKSVTQGLTTIPLAVWKGISPPEGATVDHQAAACIGLLALLVLAFWKVLAPLPLRVIPAAVIAVGLTTATAELLGWDVHRVQVRGDLAAAFTPIAWPGWDVLTLPLVWKGAVTFALIASAETLLCAVAVDGMHTGPRTQFNRELIAQGIGNTICGVFAALPLTGVIVRSAANVEAGARSRWSAILHGLWLLLFVAFLPGLLARIPDAALAAVLVYTGWKLVNLPGLKRLWQIGPGTLANHLVTAGAIVALDLLQGVMIGMALAALRLLWSLTHVTVSWQVDPARSRIECYIAGAATFVRLPQIAECLESIPPRQKLHIHLERLQFIDHACLELLMTFQRQYEATGGTVFLDWDQLVAHFRWPGGHRHSDTVAQPNGSASPAATAATSAAVGSSVEESHASCLPIMPPRN